MSDIATRAVKTFVQAFLGVLMVGLTPLVELVLANGIGASKTAVVALLVAAVSAGLSAIQNFIKQTM